MGPVLICGAGAIGCWLAGRLAGAGESIHLLGRSSRIASLSANGLVLETAPAADPKGAGQTEHFTETTIHFHDRPEDLVRAPDLLIMAVRAYQTADAADRLVEAGIRPKRVLTLQNGLGNAEVLADRFGPERVLAGTTSHGITWVDPDRARHAGPGDTVVGPWVPASAAAAHATAKRLTAAGIPTTPVDDPRAALWLKVAVNAAINPPTAIHRVENGALLDGGDLERDLRAAAREVAEVATRDGTPTDPQVAESTAVRVAERTAKNRSSMLQALLAGRPLETEAITGEVVRRAAAHGVTVPVNSGHLERLRRLQAPRDR